MSRTKLRRGVEYGVSGLAIIAFIVGLSFRLKVLLPILGLALVGSMLVAILGGRSFVETAIAVFAMQAISQTAYFAGALTRAGLRTRRIRSIP
jgi:hypothetical protein